MTNLTPEIALSNNTILPNGSHILYIYKDLDKYIENSVSFISSGLNLHQSILFIDEGSVIEIIKKRLVEEDFTTEEIESILFVDNTNFYKSNKSFDPDSLLDTFKNVLQPLVQAGKPLRHWGKVKWLEGENCLVDKLKKYEIGADAVIENLNTFGVCAYDGQKLPASTSIEIMRHHQYIMTDTVFTVSSFYHKEQLSPSIKKEFDYEEIIAKLKDVHRHYTHLIEEMPDAVFITSKESIVYANKSAIKLLECETDEVVGSYLKAITLGNEDDLLHSTNLKPTERKLLTYKGNTVDVELLSFPFLFEDIKGETTITIARNLKERKENEKMSIKNEKLGIAGQLAASIAHEIRNPLTAIKGFLKLAQEGSLGIDIYSIIDTEIDRIETIASELLVLGKPISVEIKKSNVKKLLSNVCTLMASQANMENAIINLEDVDKNLFIECNQEQMKQVFINIIKNSIEALENGGIVSIQAIVNSEHIVITIKDNGRGIPDYIKNKLGEPFYSTKEKGTGLGLMVCYNIIEQHHGTIDFISEEGIGTIFTINLPLVKEDN